MSEKRSRLSACCGIGCVAALLAVGTGQAQILPLIPAPSKVDVLQGSVTVAQGAIVAYPRGDAAAKFDAEHLAELAQRTIGLRLKIKAGDTHAVIVLERKGEVGEGYDIAVNEGRVVVSAKDDAGLYYGTVTIWQLLSGHDSPTDHVVLNAVHIHDAPQMKWRGLMLDSARHMQSIAFIRQLVDWMSLEKLNTLHWHLTDDQGWRLEIKRYPKLTSVGGYRELASEEGEVDPATGKPYPKYGGFYSQEQVKDLVAYAAKRNVTIVPEIEMPGHASAALAAYPEFGVAGAEVLRSPANHYGIFPNLYGVNDATFGFIESVLTEVMELFPSQYIHVGGDEAIKPQWKASPEIQAQIKKLGLKDEDELQSYFIKRIDTFLTAHGRRTLGWDEILQGGLAPNAAVMSWHGVSGGVEAAKLGHDAVLTPVRPLYFNYRQSDAPGEAPGRSAINSLADVYKFDPLPATLSDRERSHILGVQANVWSEYVITDDRVEWMLFPRAAALAEIGWSSAANRDWATFEARMPAEFARYKELGISFDPVLFRVRTVETINPAKNSVDVSLTNQAGAGTVRYTTDGAVVSGTSPVYRGRFEAKLPTHLKAATFANQEVVPGSELDRVLDSVSIRRTYSQDTKLCVSDPAIAFEQDPPRKERPVMLSNYRTPCWIVKAAVMDGVRNMKIEMATLPWMFADGEHKPPTLEPSKTPFGELVIHQDVCAGKVIATVPLPKVTRMDTRVILETPVPQLAGVHDICIQELRPQLNPLWVLNFVQWDLTK